MKKEPSHTKSAARTYPGFSLVEVLVAISVFLLFSSAMVSVVLGTGRLVERAENKERALFLAEEALEALRNMRDADFRNLTDGTHGFSTASGKWTFSGSSDTTGIFTRSVILSTVNENQKKAEARVSWTDRVSANSLVSVSTYLTNWRTITPIAGLTLRKVIVNRGGSKTAADFAPYLVGTTTVELNTPIELSPGTYAVSETANPDYVLTYSEDCNASGAVTLGAGEAKRCTLTNEEKPATLTVTKVVVNRGQSASPSDFTLMVDGVPVRSGDTNTFNSGTRVVSEVLDNRYTATFSGDCNASGAVTLAPGSAKTCTITNEEKPSRVVVHKTVINSGGSKTAADFAPYQVGSTTVSLGTSVVMNSGTYVVSEKVDPNYVQTFSGDCNAGGTIVLVPGETKTCTITNSEQGPTTGNWGAARQSGSLNLPKSRAATKIEVQGAYAYAIRSDSSNNFVVLSINNPDAPSLVAELSIVGTPTNLFVAGNYVYVTSTDNVQELQIVDVSAPASPRIVGTYNAPGNADALSVFVVGTMAYVVQAESSSTEFSVVSVSSPSAPVQRGTLELGATAYEVVVSGRYAYVASGSDTKEIQVIDVFNPSAPSLVGSLNLAGSVDATTISRSGSMLFVGQGTDFRVVSVANPTAPAQVGTLSISGTVSDIALDVAASYGFLATRAHSAEFQVVSVASSTSPQLSSSVDISGSSALFGVAYSVARDRVYGAGQSSSEEITVFAPQ